MKKIDEKELDKVQGGAIPKYTNQPIVTPHDDEQGGSSVGQVGGGDKPMQ